MTFGEKLYRLRKEWGMSQEALAQELGVSRQAISRWELEEVAPDTGNVLAASRLFGVSTDYLLRDECEQEADTPAVRRAERSLQERQAAVGKGVLCRVLWLTLFALFHQYRLEQLETGGSPVPIPWLLVPALALAVWTWRLNWRYIQEGGRETSSAGIRPAGDGLRFCTALPPCVGPRRVGNLAGAAGRGGMHGEKR